MIHCYITFPTVYCALRAETLLATETYASKLVPVPRIISSSCGTAMRCSCRDAGPITALLEKNRVEYDSIHQLADNVRK